MSRRPAKGRDGEPKGCKPQPRPRSRPSCAPRAGLARRTGPSRPTSPNATSVDLHTIHDWWYEDAEDAKAFNNHRLKMMVDQDLEIAVRTGELVRDRIEEETDTFKLVGAYKISRDAVNNWVRASQDQKRTNELADAIRRNLKMPDDERRALVAEIER